ncbi:exported protein of unknown function [Nitrosotalea devaniterrae]|uniref:Uncharacterized protein n=1 Tax=Nitrosotalea devaniterrae TaxID=1078905 RepID=A0A128A3N3_9ARCH|nr:exported protein of unknown function [Candidatus Nitrosotalea devanaterra]
MKNNKIIGRLVLAAGLFISVLFGGFTIMAIHTVEEQKNGNACKNPASSCPLPDVQGFEFYTIIGVILSIIGIVIIMRCKRNIPI